MPLPPARIDDRDRADLARFGRALLARLDVDDAGPQQGHHVTFTDGTVARVAYRWPEHVQTCRGGSWHLGPAGFSHSGSLARALPVDLFTLDPNGPALVTAWTFHHQIPQANSAVYGRVWTPAWHCAAPYPRYTHNDTKEP